MPRGWCGAVPGGGWPATAVRGVWCQALSLPRPPVPWGGQPPGFRDPCVPGAVDAGVGTQYRPHRLALQRGPLRAGVARCGNGGRASPGGGAVRRCEGRLGSGAPPPPAARPLGWLSGSATHVLWARVCGRGCPAPAPWLACPVGGCTPRGWRGASRFRRPLFPAVCPLGGLPGPAVGAGVGVCGVCGVCAVRVVVRGAAFRLSLWCSPLRCFGAVLCPPCAVCLQCSLPCARPLLGCWLPPVSFVASSIFMFSSARPSPWHALFPCLRSGVCLCLFLCRLVFLSHCAL